jgi:hypothetical protein
MPAVWELPTSRKQENEFEALLGQWIKAACNDTSPGSEWKMMMKEKPYIVMMKVLAVTS